MFDDLIENNIWNIRNQKTGKVYNVQGHQKLVEFISQIPESEREHWSLKQQDSSIEQPLSLLLGMERRRHPRYKTRIRVKFVGEDSYFEAHTKDISLEGLKIGQRIPEFIGSLRFAFIFIEDEEKPPVVAKVNILENSMHSTRIHLSGNLVRYQNWIQQALSDHPNLNQIEEPNAQNIVRLKLNAA